MNATMPNTIPLFIDGTIGRVDLSFLCLRPGDSVLDLGCARGYSLAELSRRGCRSYGVELLLPLVREAQLLQRSTGSTSQLLAASAMAVPFDDASFDAVICTEVIEHVPNAGYTLAEIGRVLKPGGRLCLSLPTWFTENVFNRLDPNFAAYCGHLRVFGPGEIQKLLRRQGFEIDYMCGHYFEWSLYWLLRSLTLKTPAVFYEDAPRTARLDRWYKRLWRIADRALIGGPIKAIGDRIYPKSHYFYCHKR